MVDRLIGYVQNAWAKTMVHDGVVKTDTAVNEPPPDEEATLKILLQTSQAGGLKSATNCLRLRLWN